jgi:ribonuclease P protein component
MAGARFNKSQRLPNAAAFSAVFKASELRAGSPELLLLARHNDLETARLGVIVSKKNCRLATGRNRLKRLIRESFRHQQDALHGLDIVVLVKRGLAERDNGQVNEQLDRAWNRLLKHASRNDARSRSSR